MNIEYYREVFFNPGRGGESPPVTEAMIFACAQIPALIPMFFIQEGPTICRSAKAELPNSQTIKQQEDSRVEIFTNFLQVEYNWYGDLKERQIITRGNRQYKITAEQRGCLK
ncbi:hypothetical protein [Rhodohalobacter sp.]|uniref:hypothetical protein n=1 Tax=Rhodohalobacter sp. TaxID=1974210 RepID=UPI002ACECD5B|nr:hypothetical protein [Rhodohalobacter sp.]MDZ7758256.1 hypothetical protein [Rhodohalobacter sp.]